MKWLLDHEMKRLTRNIIHDIHTFTDEELQGMVQALAHKNHHIGIGATALLKLIIEREVAKREAHG